MKMVRQPYPAEEIESQPVEQPTAATARRPQRLPAATMTQAPAPVGGGTGPTGGLAQTSQPIAGGYRNLGAGQAETVGGLNQMRGNTPPVRGPIAPSTPIYQTPGGIGMPGAQLPEPYRPMQLPAIRQNTAVVGNSPLPGRGWTTHGWNESISGGYTPEYWQSLKAGGPVNAAEGMKMLPGPVSPYAGVAPTAGAVARGVGGRLAGIASVLAPAAGHLQDVAEQSRPGGLASPPPLGKTMRDAAMAIPNGLVDTGRYLVGDSEAPGGRSLAGDLPRLAYGVGRAASSVMGNPFNQGRALPTWDEAQQGAGLSKPPQQRLQNPIFDDSTGAPREMTPEELQQRAAMNARGLREEAARTGAPQDQQRLGGLPQQAEEPDQITQMVNRFVGDALASMDPNHMVKPDADTMHALELADWNDRRLAMQRSAAASAKQASEPAGMSRKAYFQIDEAARAMQKEARDRASVNELDEEGKANVDNLAYWKAKYMESIADAPPEDAGQQRGMGLPQQRMAAPPTLKFPEMPQEQGAFAAPQAPDAEQVAAAEARDERAADRSAAVAEQTAARNNKAAEEQAQAIRKRKALLLAQLRAHPESTDLAIADAMADGLTDADIKEVKQMHAKNVLMGGQGKMVV